MPQRSRTARIDPSRTSLIRRAFEREMLRYLRELKREIVKLIVTDDAFDLTPAEPFNILERKQYRFRTSSQKVDAFVTWLQSQTDAKLLGLGKGGSPWTSKYVESAYKKGLLRSYGSLRKFDLSKPAGFIEGSKAEFLRSTFAQPERLDKIRFLATRTFNGMKGMTDAMKSDLNRILADGLANGRGARAIARDITKRIDTIGRKRALVIARTETIAAHAQGQLDGFRDLGVDAVGAEVEWSTAGDDHVCPECSDMEGKVFTLDEAQGKIPLHPNCRCAWIPVIEPPKKKGKSRPKAKRTK